MQRAGQRIIQAKQLSPDIPQIDLAIVRSMQGGIYMNLVSGTLSQCAPPFRTAAQDEGYLPASRPLWLAYSA